MRVTKRKEVLSVFQTLHKAHDILKQIPETDVSSVNDVLVLCQNGAIQIGNEIERWYGEGTRTVSLLEDYCEAVYQYTKTDSLYCKTAYGRMIETLAQAESRFQKEITTDKLEVVFFPYNASMWASMDSVWKAADKDKECNAYVVPIPYFEKETDGSFGKMHYEGHQLPKDVPITSWKDYSVAERCPDMIFIHNPYDQNNYVTSVHPNYYASVLKDYTAKLIYLPYYLFVDDSVNESSLMTSASLYADFIVEQSEKSCKKCIQIYDDFLKKNGLAGKLKEGKDKFLPLGSPIVDSLKQNISMDEIPQAWQYIIHQKGKQAKIVLYNTGVSDLTVPRAESFFKKLESVFQIFREQTDIVLLWRPHPLSWHTIHSMNPNAAKRYQQIVDRYRDEEWGIYDDTPDVNRAVAISDAYYGDWSSLITMFQLTGKPAMRQAFEAHSVHLQSNGVTHKAFIEENEMGLQVYLRSIKKHIYSSKENSSIGKMIWEYLRKL